MFTYTTRTKMVNFQTLTTWRCSAPSSILACSLLAFPVISLAHQYSLHLGSLHNISLDLQLAAHEQLLRIRLASHKLSKVLVAQHKRDGRLLAFWREALADCASLLQVDEPRLGVFCVVLECEGEDDAALLDGVLLVGGRVGEGL